MIKNICVAMLLNRFAEYWKNDRGSRRPRQSNIHPFDLRQREQCLAEVFMGNPRSDFCQLGQVTMMTLTL
jgi:hypothetical protein